MVSVVLIYPCFFWLDLAVAFGVMCELEDKVGMSLAEVFGNVLGDLAGSKCDSRS